MFTVKLSKASVICAAVLLLGLFVLYQSSGISSSHELSAGYHTIMSKAVDASRRNKVSGLAEKRRRLPKALIIGFNKCGSSTLQTFLTIHPDVVGPFHEVRFFNDHYSKGLEWYRRQMPRSTSRQLTIEKTPGYIKSLEILKRIYKFDPNIKLIAIIRNPVTRLLSEHAHALARNRTHAKTFEEWMCQGESFEKKVIKSSDYLSKIQLVYSLFPEDHLIIVSEEDLEADPASLIRQVHSFLGLRPAISDDVFVFNETKGFYCVNKTHPFFSSLEQFLNEDGCMSERKGRKHAEIGQDTLLKIVETSRPYVEQLFQTISMKFKWNFY